MIMNTNDDQFSGKLFDIFRAEALEHIAALSEGFLLLEKSPFDLPPELLERLSRKAHTFKGAARAVNQSDIETLCMSLENALVALKKQPLKPSGKLFDLLNKSLDLINSILAGNNPSDQIGQVQDDFDSS